MVDEGQDFHELWWTSVESVFKDPVDKTCYYVFFDPNQNLYVQEPCLPEEFGQPYLLQENCRNTVRIATHYFNLSRQMDQTAKNFRRIVAHPGRPSGGILDARARRSQ